MKYLALLLLLPAAALAQQCPAPPTPQTPCPSDRVCISWQGPADNSDGSRFESVQLPLTYRIWRRSATGQWQRLTYSTQGLSIGLVGEPRGLQCYAVTAIDALGRESGMSCYSCKTVRFPGPSDGRIERPSDGRLEGNKE
jgi:hypothetical protein